MLPAKCFAWRVEHRDTRDGVIMHVGAADLWKAFNTSKRAMCDIDEIPHVAELISLHRPKFGFVRLRAIEKMVRNPKLLHGTGFVLSKYLVVPLYIHEEDTQVIFSDMQLIREYNFC